LPILIILYFTPIILFNSHYTAHTPAFTGNSTNTQQVDVAAAALGEQFEKLNNATKSVYRKLKWPCKNPGIALISSYFLLYYLLKSSLGVTSVTQMALPFLIKE